MCEKNRFGEILHESILIDFGIHSNFVADKKKCFCHHSPQKVALLALNQTDK
jgi:hypothetical protein